MSAAAALDYARVWLEEAALDRTRKQTALRPLYKRCEEALATYWLRQATLTLEALNKATWQRITGITEVLDPDEQQELDLLTELLANSSPDWLGKALVSTLNGAELEGMELAHDNAIADMGVDVAFNTKHPVAVDYFDKHGLTRLKNINDTTAKGIHAIIRDGIAKGTPYNQVAKQIAAKYAGFAAPSPLGHIRSRAELIAVTEMGDAYVAGTVAAGKELKAAGLAIEKHWLTVGDHRVDEDTCRKNEAAGWIEMDEHFPSGHANPLGHPGCRCDLQTRVAKSGLKPVPTTAELKKAELEAKAARPAPKVAKAPSKDVATDLILKGEQGPTAIAAHLKAEYPDEDWTGLKVTHLKQKMQKQGAISHTPKPRAAKAPKPPTAKAGESRFVPGPNKEARAAAEKHLNTGRVSASDAKDKIAKDISGKLKGNPAWDDFVRRERTTFSAAYSRDDDYNGVNMLISRWAGTSGDDNPQAIAMQVAAHREFGLSDGALHATVNHLTPELRAKVDAEVRANGAGYQAFLRAMHTNTQETFAAQGITHVNVYRGQAVSGTWTPDWVRTHFGDVAGSSTAKRNAAPQLRPLSSFSPTLNTAKSFSSALAEGRVRAKAVFEATVPVDRVIGTARTGFGCLHETEIVVLETPGEVTVHLTTFGGGSPESWLTP